MSFIQGFPGFIVQLQPPVLQVQPPLLQLQPPVLQLQPPVLEFQSPVLQLQPPVLPAPNVPVMTEPLAVVKKEPPEIVEINVNDIRDSSDEENVPDIKKVDLVSHIKNPDSIKSESVPNNVLEADPLESVGTQVFVKTEKIPFVKVENINEDENLDKTETVGDGNVNKGTQDSNEYFNALDNLGTDEQLILNFSADLNGIRSTKPEHPEKIDFAECYRTFETTSWEGDKEKIKVIQASGTKVLPHEYITLDKDRHVCNHCQHASRKLKQLKYHIQKMHREVTTMYQCPYCPFQSKWSLRYHIIQKHKDTKDIQWFECHSCDMKFKLKCQLAKHTLVHLTHEQLQDKLKLCPVCGKGFKTGEATKRHVRFVHNKEAPKRMKCQKCDYTTANSQLLKNHIEARHMDFEQRQTYKCSQCDYTTKYKYLFENHSKSHEKRYCCAKCAFITGQIGKMKLHELSHKKISEIDDRDLKYRCDKCNYKTYRQYSFDVHKLNHLKPEEIQYLYCYHCPFKAKRKDNLKTHILRHFKNEEVNFHCYICKFVTKDRDLITEHIKQHSKVQSEPKTNEGS